MNIIFAKHYAAKAFAFEVPEHLAGRLKKGDILLVNTNRGDELATATTGVIGGEGAMDIAKANGAYEPLKSVISYLSPEMEKYIMVRARDRVITALSDSITKDPLPFFA